jgi:outer membrane protein W
LTSSVGPVVTGGVTYRISDRWAAHASYSWSQVKTNLTADTDGIIRTTHISFGPQALIVSVGYSF